MPNPCKVVKVRFLNAASNGRFTISSKEYNYYVEKRTFEYFLATTPTNKLTSQDAVPKFHIVNENGNNYRNAEVLITGIEDAYYKNQDYTYLRDIDYIGLISFSKLASESWTKIAKRFDLSVPMEAVMASCPSHGHTWSPYAQGGYVDPRQMYAMEAAKRAPDPYSIAALSQSPIKITPKEEIKKGEQKMFGNLMKGLQFGKVSASQVRMSTLGMAIMSKNGEAYAYDEKKEEFIDVSDFLLDDMDFFYAVPAAKKDVSIGDYILHDNTVVRVVDVNDRGNLVAYKILTKEEVVIIATKNLFGFDFYTKIVNLAGNLFGAANADSPFGNILPLLLMKDSGDNNNLLMFMMMQNGGMGTNFASNPLMMYALMKDKGGSNDILPLLLMSSGAFGATAASTKTAE